MPGGPDIVKPTRTSWVMRLPHGIREQPAWVFIGTLSALTGMSYFLGISRSVAVASVIEQGWLRGWGVFLCFSGILVVVSTVSSNKPLERLALRFLSLGLLVYLGWVLTATPPTKAMITTLSCVSLVVLAEIRVAVLKVVLRPPPVILDREDIE